MSGHGSILGYLRDPRLTAHATSASPAWLWSADATRVLWANPTAAAIFDAPSPAAMAGSTIDPRGTAALQIARLAGTLPHGAPPRLERLRGFGTRFRALMCACSRVSLADRTAAILVVAVEPAGPNLPLVERVRRLFDGCDEPIAVFAPDGTLLHVTQAGEAPLHGLKSLAALGAEKLAGEALAAGKAAGGSHVGEVTIERIGADAATVLMVAFARAADLKPAATIVPPVETPAPLAETPVEPLETTIADIVAAPPLPEPAALEAPKPVAIQEISPTPSPTERRQPLRFVWQMEADGRFTISSDEFIELIGPQAAAALGRPWSEIAETLGLDTDGQVARAFASHDTWSGIVVKFPVDGTNERLPVDLSGLPIFDRDRSFRGYRGFGVCRDVARIAALMQMRRTGEPAPKLEHVSEIAPEPEPKNEQSIEQAPEQQSEPAAIREERPALSVVPKPENVVPFRSSAPPAQGPTSVPSLTPVERTAFRELASRLTARLKGADDKTEPPVPPASPEVPAAEPPAPPPIERAGERTPLSDQRPILDRLPVGVLVYRLDKLIYANRAFLDWTGYEQLSALAEAGGLDALFVEPGTDTLGKDASKNGAKTLTIATTRGDQMPVEARLFTTPWDGESALVLMLANASPTPNTPSKASDDALRAAAAEARELRSILDSASDGVIVLDRDGRVISVNRSAEVLFGYESRELSGLPFAGLFAPESQGVAFDALDRLNRPGASQPAEGREVIGRVRQGSLVPLFMTVGYINEGSDKLFAIFRDVTPWKKVEEDLVTARLQAEKASSAKSDFLAKVSHEIRTPLNAIIGFSEVMMEERFGPVGNERYRQYLRDIHASGEHLVSLLNDLLDLSKIEAGKLELSFASVDLNELTQQCVALMQPQASRERVIVRTSLAPSIPLVMADARSVRQIALNLLSNSIKFTGAGGQVIVSTALSDGGEVVLRVRDTGVGMSEKEIAIALEPFRQLATSSRWGSNGTGLGLPLTKALAEANRATFSIKSAVNAGTLVEVAFPGARMAAE